MAPSRPAQRPKKLTIGRLEHISLPNLGFERVEAKVDTGAYRSALHFQRVRTRAVDGRQELVVTFRMGGKRRTIVFKKARRVKVKSSTGQVTSRWLVSTRVELNGYSARAQFTLFDRSDMKYQVLLGRTFLSGRFVVDVSVKNLLG